MKLAELLNTTTDSYLERLSTSEAEFDKTTYYAYIE